MFGKDDSIPALLQDVRDRSNESGWTDIFDISVGLDTAGATIFRNLLTHYGDITLTNVRANNEAD